MVLTKPSHHVLAQHFDDAEPLTDQSPHLCRSSREISSLVVDVPQLPWGYVPFPVHRLTPHSLSSLVHQMRAGDVVAHRRIPVGDNTPEPEKPPIVSTPTTAVYSRDDSQRACPRRRADLEDIAGIDEVLAEIDARAKELEQRTAAILAGESPTFTVGL